MEITSKNSLDIFKASIERVIGRSTGAWFYSEESVQLDGSLLEIHSVIATTSPSATDARWHERRKTIILQIVKQLLKSFKAKNARLRSVNDTDIVSVSPVTIEADDSDRIESLSILELDTAIDIVAVFKILPIKFIPHDE